MKKLCLGLLFALSTLSCRQVKSPASAAQKDEFFRLVIYQMEVLPAGKYQGFIRYFKEDGQVDSILTEKPWRYEFKAHNGDLLRVKVAARPVNPAQTTVGMVRFYIQVDGNLVDTGIGQRMDFEYKFSNLINRTTREK